MTRFVWNSTLETGVRRIDEQHQELFRLANALDALLEREVTDDEPIADAIWALTDYVVQHFADEEELMASSGFPMARAHKMQHQRLSGETLKLAADYFNGQQVAVERLAPFVAKWLTEHILADDIEIAKHMAGS